MHLHFFDYLELSDKLIQTLDELKAVGTISKYEIHKSRHQISYVPLNDSAHFTLGVILGQFDSVRSIPIGQFKKAREKFT